MLGISRHDHVTNESVYSQIQARPLSSEVKGRQLRFLGHSPRRDKEDHINRFALYVPSVGRRSVGGQKRLFLQYISRVIMGGSRALTEREIRHATVDRDYWRHLVAACRDNSDWTADETRGDETRRDWAAGAASTANLTNHNRSFRVIGRAFMRLICLSLWRKHWPSCSFWRI